MQGTSVRIIRYSKQDKIMELDTQALDEILLKQIYDTQGQKWILDQLSAIVDKECKEAGVEQQKSWQEIPVMSGMTSEEYKEYYENKYQEFQEKYTNYFGKEFK